MAGRFPHSPRFWWLSLLGLAVVLRLGVMVVRTGQLTTDRDLYLGIATELRAGQGYSTPGSEPPAPTAFRPPLYPLMLSCLPGTAFDIGLLHLILAVAMVSATGQAAKRLAGGQWQVGLLAGGIVAVDPLLLLYSGQPMTETLCSCLTAVLLWRIVSSEPTQRGAILEGLIWGLCLLSRPTYAAPLGLCILGRVVFRPATAVPPAILETSQTIRPRLRFGLLVLIAAAVVVSPWAIRNWLVFEKPIVTTTHGGYTLWLANNPVYYTEVVEGGDAAWNGESLTRWQTETNAEMDRLRVQGEVARDQWQAARAKQFIAQHPWRFWRACLYRAATFWSIFPGRASETGVPQPLLWIIASGYAAVGGGGIVALGRLLGDRSRGRISWGPLWPVCSLILGFFGVHLVYWTDVRMRAPIMPAVAVWVAVGLRGPAGRSSEESPSGSAHNP